MIHPFAFSSAQNLECLTIISDSLQILPANAFDGATKLVGIALLGCPSLIQADEAAFVGLDNLLNLEIWSTPLGPSPTDIFKPLINLTSIISLIQIYIEKILAELFANNLKLESIQIADSDIKGVERTFIDDLENLTFIAIESSCANATFDSSSSSATY